MGRIFLAAFSGGARMQQAQPIRHLSKAALAALLAGVATPALTAAAAGSGSSAASAAADAQPAPDQSSRDQTIYVTGRALYPDIQPERSLDQDAIDSYGASTVDEILNDLQVELGEDAEQPLIIVNGRRINDLSQIGALPVEVLQNIQVLPRGSALRVGGTGTQRVVSIVLKPRVRTETLTAAHKIATEGNWNAERGEAIVTSVKGDTRANLTFRTRDETSLLESDRGIIQPVPSHPFAQAGNIIGFPNTAGEIDPLLSAVAGHTVTVVPFPTGVPTLQQLAAVANQQNTTDLGRFRTLRPDSRNYDLNGNFATQLAPWLSVDAALRWSSYENRSLRGLPSALFILSPTNPFSPFSTRSAIALYGNQLLHSHSTHHGTDANVTFNANWGVWRGNLNLRHNVTSDVFSTERQSNPSSITLADNVNPFATNLADLFTLRTDTTRSRANNSLADLTFNGPLLHVPAGDVLATIEGRVGWNRLSANSSFAQFGNGTFRRNEQTIRAGVEVPFTAHDSGIGAAIGDLSGSFEYAHSHFSDAGSVNHYTYGLTWEPRPTVRLHASIDRTDLPASIQTLGNPVIITPNVRAFDPLTGQTVDVTQISGGNPSLLPQQTKIRDISALFRLAPRLNLQMNAEYTDTDVRNFVSGLPEASAAVELAFPDRFIRDPNGVLTTIDLRPVNFDSHREKRLRWGLSMNAKISGTPPPPVKGQPRRPPRPATYFQLTANHTIVFSDQIVIRPDLPSVNLLSGGAIGIGGGRPRHQIDGTAAITSGGIGARVGVTWRGPNELISRFNGVTDTLHFSPLLAVNLRAFADLKRLVPNARWAKGFRVSVDVINAFDRRQTVHDSFGNTPLQYQPGYRDPLGRTVEVELRKVF